MTGTLSKETKVTISSAVALALLLLRLSFAIFDGKAVMEARIEQLKTDQAAKTAAIEVLLVSYQGRLLIQEQRIPPTPLGQRWTCTDQERFLYDLRLANYEKLRIPPMRKSCE